MLCEFEPRQVVERYGEADRLIADLARARGLSSTEAERQRKRAGAAFNVYGRGVLQAARYFAGFGSAADFIGMIGETLAQGREAVILLPYELRFTGFSYALAADFLKEVGVLQLGKPDVHLCRVLAKLGWCGQSADPEDVQGCLWDLWHMLGEEYEPVIIDKLVFLAGSGRFEMVLPAYRCDPCWQEIVRECTGEEPRSTMTRRRRCKTGAMSSGS